MGVTIPITGPQRDWSIIMSPLSFLLFDRINNNNNNNNNNKSLGTAPLKLIVIIYSDTYSKY